MQAASPNGLPVVYVGRPSKYGNPFRIGVNARDYSTLVVLFETWLAGDISGYGDPPTIEEIKRALRDKNLCCWCPLDRECHVSVLLKIANE